MQVDINHVLFWMDAIRNSSDSKRTLEAFWKGQIHSKIWLIDNLKPYVQHHSIDIHGGWVGVLASLLFQSGLDIKHIRSLDIDPDCEETARTMNKIEEMAGKFSTVTADMCTTGSTADIVINTVCEHLTQEQYNVWLSNLRTDSLIVLQGNNYSIPEHVRISNNLEHFKQQSGLDVWWAGELELSLYTRYMIIGKQ